jgi:hypothetical protein
MKLKVDFLDKQKIEKELVGLTDLDFSLFVESIPQSEEDLSPINIIALYEPNEYFGKHDWVIKNKNLFNAILTWNDKILNNCDNAIYLPFGHTWLQPDQYEKNYIKEFKIAHLCGTLLKSYGHQMRHEILDRKEEIKIPTKFFHTYGDRHNIERARIDKEEILSDSMFAVAIENFAHRGWFSEKILDCFLLKTIPIYWGCSNIGDYFNTNGIIKFESPDDFIYVSNQLTPQYYESKKEFIEENWRLALSYVNYEKNIVNKIKEIFILNKIITE